VKTKAFDCVGMKRRGAEHVFSIIRDMTPAEELEYWQRRTQELRQEQARLRSQSPQAVRSDAGRAGGS
jgi:hypothetical protein